MDSSYCSSSIFGTVTCSSHFKNSTAFRYRNTTEIPIPNYGRNSSHTSLSKLQSVESLGLNLPYGLSTSFFSTSNPTWQRDNDIYGSITIDETFSDIIGCYYNLKLTGNIVSYTISGNKLLGPANSEINFGPKTRLNLSRDKENGG